MKKALAVIGMLFGLGAVAFAGTPQENLYMSQAPLSNATILASSAATTSAANITLTISTPTAIPSGGGTYTGRNCFTKIIVQMSTATVLTLVDGATTKWTINGLGLGASGVNTLTLTDDHLGPLCTLAGDQTQFTLTSTTGGAVPQSINVEGYTTYGGTLNQGPMY